MASLKPIKTKCFATLGHSGLVVFPIDSNDRRKVMIPAPVVTVLTPSVVTPPSLHSSLSRGQARVPSYDVTNVTTN